MVFLPLTTLTLTHTPLVGTQDSLLLDVGNLSWEQLFRQSSCAPVDSCSAAERLDMLLNGSETRAAGGGDDEEEEEEEEESGADEEEHDEPPTSRVLFPQEHRSTPSASGVMECEASRPNQTPMMRALASHREANAEELALAAVQDALAQLDASVRLLS